MLCLGTAAAGVADTLIKANMNMVKARAKADPARRWGFVFAIARTWKTVKDKSTYFTIQYWGVKNGRLTYTTLITL